MTKTSQTSMIELEIIRLVDEGETDVSNIYSIIVDKFNVPRPTVRRARKKLVERLYKELDVLDTSDNGGKSTNA